MEDKMIKGLVAIAAGSIIFKVGMEVRNRRLQKELYSPGLEEVVIDEHSDKE